VSDGIAKSSIHSLADGVALYRGHLLEGFYVSESPDFEDWVLLMRDRLQRQAATALRALVTQHTRLGDYESARRYAWRWVELEPWQEAAHRHLMRVLALSGRRTEALAQFEVCCRTLQEEFGVEPSPATVRVFEQLRDGAVVPESPTPLPIIFTPPPVIEAGPIAEQDTQPFVAREQELAQLNEHLKDALKGQGHVVFVTGEAGYGKTALMQAFIRSAQGVHAHLVVLEGSCNAYPSARCWHRSPAAGRLPRPKPGEIHGAYRACCR
jgi:transcriptional regulator of acetoin/glycerol metabolism